MRASRGHRSSAAGAAARRPSEIPRIVGATVNGIRRLPVREHRRHVGFADKHATGFFEACGYGAVFDRYVISQRREARCGAHACHRMGIFQREWHAVQRSPHLIASQRFIRFTCSLTRMFRIDRDDGVQRRIAFIDLRQMGAQNFCG